jgi:hypothetical protein
MSDDEIDKLLKERDLFLRELLASRKSLDELTVMVAKQNDRLDEVITMLRRRETQLKQSEREVRKLRKLLGMDDPDPEPDTEPVPPKDDAAPRERDDVRGRVGDRRREAGR